MANLKLVLGVLSISSLVALGNGYNQRQVEDFSTTERSNSGGESCDFPRHAFRCDCCTMPEEILGNLSASFRKCFGKKWDEYRNNRNQSGGKWEGKYRYSARQEIGPDDERGNDPQSSTPEYDSGERPREGPGGSDRPQGEGPDGRGEDRPGGPGDSDRPEGQGPDGPGEERPRGPGEERPGGPGGQGPGEERPGGPGGRGPGEERPGGPGGQGPGEERPGGPGGRGPGEERPGGPGGRGPGGPGGRGPGGPGGRGPGGPGGRGPGGPGGRGPGGPGSDVEGGPDCDKGSGRGRGRGHHFRGGPRDGCLMECVFQEENWLEQGKVNIEEILKRIDQAKNAENSKWIDAAQSAVQKCARTPAAEGKKCQSGSEEFFMCMGREIFINCPEFKDEISECNTLRDFYDRCPATHPVPLRCHHHGPSRGNGEEPMRYRGGPQHYHHDHH